MMVQSCNFDVFFWFVVSDLGSVGVGAISGGGRHCMQNEHWLLSEILCNYRSAHTNSSQKDGDGNDEER